MSNTGARIKPEEVREITSIAITTSWQQLGPAFDRVVRAFSFDNDFDSDVYLTLDPTAVIGGFRCRKQQAKIWDLKTNDTTILPGDKIYIRATSAVSSGDFFMESITS